jgi:hypothetical protein
MNPAAVLAAVRRTLEAQPHVFSAFEQDGVLHAREITSGKSLAIDLRTVETLEEKESPGSGGRYLVLRFENGRQLVLCHAGFGFPPSFVNTGPLPGLPQVLSMRDFQTLLPRLAERVPAAERRAEALDLVRLLIALLDGARAVGLDVGEEERALDGLLTALERTT